MEKFKDFTDIEKVDVRNTYFKNVNQKTGELTERTISDLHKEISSIILIEKTPETIQNSFNIAKNLSLYSWYCYPFHQISEMKAYSALEEALKVKFGKSNKGLKGLIKKAILEGHVTDAGFKHIPTPKHTNSIEYCEQLINTIPDLRNDLAHGSQTLHNHSKLTLTICASFINQLFE